MGLERLPRVGETVTDGTFTQTYGGKGANQAVAAARAGGRVSFLTCVGDDAFGRAMLENFRGDGIDVGPARTVPGVPTGSALVMFDRRGDNYLAVAPGANYALTPQHVDENAALIGSSAMLVLQMEIPVPATRRALEIASARGVPVLFNFAPARTGELPVSDRMTGLVVNEAEAESLCGLPVRSPEEALAAAEALLGRGPKFVVLTLGAQGAYVASQDVRRHVPAFPVTPVDATAAGDVFCGALAVALVEGMPLGEAARFAGAAAALSVMQAGAQPSIPRRAEIDRFLRTYTP